MTMIIIRAVALLVLSASVSAAAQDNIQRAKDLYAAAAYEEALALLTMVPAEARTTEVDQYRAVCLIALGQKANAEAVIEAIFTKDPLYVPNAAETSPRVMEAFAEVRLRLLPTVTRQMYVDAKAALDRKDRAAAMTGFERVLRVLATAPRHQQLDDLKVLAEGFLDLTKALPATAIPAENQVEASASAVGDAVGSAPTGPASSAARTGTVGFTRPVALKQTIPSWHPPDPASRRAEYEGSLRVQVGKDGKVQSAQLVRRMHPMYDQLLLRVAKDWLYEPATQNGVPVPSEVIVEVRLRPEK